MMINNNAEREWLKCRQSIDLNRDKFDRILTRV